MNIDEKSFSRYSTVVLKVSFVFPRANDEISLCDATIQYNFSYRLTKLKHRYYVRLTEDTIYSMFETLASVMYRILNVYKFGYVLSGKISCLTKMFSTYFL